VLDKRITHLLNELLLNLNYIQFNIIAKIKTFIITYESAHGLCVNIFNAESIELAQEEAKLIGWICEITELDTKTPGLVFEEWS